MEDARAVPKPYKIKFDKKQSFSGVESVTTDVDKSTEVYNLQGIRLSVKTPEEIQRLPPGIYIVNGKKRFVK